MYLMDRVSLVRKNNSEECIRLIDELLVLNTQFCVWYFTNLSQLPLAEH